MMFPLNFFFEIPVDLLIRWPICDVYRSSFATGEFRMLAAITGKFRMLAVITED